VKIRPSKNRAAVAAALALFAAEEEARSNATPARGPRGIVNARRLGLSRNPRVRSKTAPKRAKGSSRRLATLLTPADRRAGCVRGKHVALLPSGYARKEYRAARREIERVMDAAIANQPRLRRKRDKMVQDALAQIMRGRATRRGQGR
jgi:hypothetical protein